MHDDRILSAVLRDDFPAFIEKVFNTVSPADEYRPNWHIEAIAHQLERVMNGKETRLLISQPPRSLKSICTSVAFVAWVLGHDPTRRFTCVSYSQELGEELARQFRLVVESPWYRKAFPQTRLNKATANEITTTRGGGRFTTSTGGTHTGRGADIIIIDDPMKAGDATSDVERRKVIEWYRSTLVSRLNNQRTGTIVLVMQRLHEEDLAGYLLEQGGWGSLVLPAIAIEDEEIPLGGGRMHQRNAGDLLHPGRISQAELDRIKAELGSLTFSAQYQQQPTPAGGNLVKREWFQSYDTAPVGDDVIITQSWDIALSTTEGRDYSVCTTWAAKGKQYYLIDVWRGRLEYPDLKRKVVSMQEQSGATRILIEAVGLGLSLAQELASNDYPGLPNPIQVKPTESKDVRLQAQSAKIEGGQVFLPREAPWLGEFMNEVLAFPNGRYDDQVDSMSQFLDNSGPEFEIPELHIVCGGGGTNPFRVY